MTLSITTLSRMTLIIMTSNIKGLFVTFSIMTISITKTQLNNTDTAILLDFTMLSIMFYLLLW